MQSIAVYCGARAGTRGALFHDAARALADCFARAGLGLVYGGSDNGVMGTLANAALDAGCHVTGVMPRDTGLKEQAHEGLSELVWVGSMTERKQEMMRLADGFIALPGGVGTLEELFEAWSCAQLDMHRKPCALLNVDGYFDGLLAFISGARASGMIAPAYADMLIVESDPDMLLTRMTAYQPPQSRWR
ncbi:LOG family protein [Marinobacterium jannaschii]|uniref:LOG family protein n=1 Tax=Marinobacterium jannaschii TaxID=64970 RepID=UPI000484E54F|nr:TIGR00730 family Rossman fold protein [Marinobacterium jannaschii]